MELKISCLCKNYGGNKALIDFSAVFTAGIYGLIGPNGAGKSTLMNLIAGNIMPSSGEILYDGNSTESLGKDFRAILGFMPQQQKLYEDFTALRFLSYMAALKGMTKAQAKKRIPTVLKMVGLEGEQNRKLKAFSGGMKQRILIAQAVLNDPQVLILDEPTAGLDPKQRIKIRNLISQISIHKIVIIATHVVSDIEYIAKEVLLLKAGTLIEQKTIPELLKTVDGKVFEIITDETGLPLLEHKYKVGNISKDENHIYTRIISDTPPKDYNFKREEPSLEDVYLYRFDDENTL